MQLSERQIYFMPANQHSELINPGSSTLHSSLNALNSKANAPSQQQISSEKQLGARVKDQSEKLLFSADSARRMLEPKALTSLLKRKKTDVRPAREVEVQKVNIKKSCVSSLSGQSRLNFYSHYDQINTYLQGQQQPPSLAAYSVGMCLIGLLTVAMILQFQIIAKQYMAYLNDNQFLLNIKQQLGRPLYNGYGAGICFRANMRELADKFISQELYNSRSLYYLQIVQETKAELVATFRNSYGNEILWPVWDHPQTLYKSMHDLTRVYRFNGTYKLVMYEMLR